MSAPLIVCPQSPATGHNGQGGKGYTAGGAAYHATRCADMATIIGVDAPEVVGKGPQTLDEAIAAAASKWAAKSQPQAAALAGERVIFGSQSGTFIPD